MLENDRVYSKLELHRLGFSPFKQRKHMKGKLVMRIRHRNTKEKFLVEETDEIHSVKVVKKCERR